MLAAILLAPLLHHVTCEDTIQYIGCFKPGGRDGDAIRGGQSYTDDVFNKCKDLALVKGYTVFAIYDNQYCYTSHDAHKTFADNGESEGCSKSWVGDRYIEQGGENAMSVYQIVGHKKEEFNWNDIIKCEQESETMNELIMIFDAELSFGLGPTYENVTKYVRDTCDASKECTLYYDDMFSNDPPTKLTVTYGCLYSGLKVVKSESENIGITISKNIRWIVFVLIILVGVPCMWYRRRNIIRHHPYLRGCCWGMHTTCPCLKLYPSDATHQDHGMGGVVANPLPDNNSPRTVTHQPVSFSANPTEPPTYPPSVMPPSYPPPASTVNIPYQPPSNDLPPPPTYDAATTGTSRTSGGWFSKLAQ